MPTIPPYNKSKSLVVNSVKGTKYAKDKSRLDNITEENSDSTPLRIKPDDLDSLLLDEKPYP